MGKYIAFLDILGFKEIILNNPHEKVVELFENFRIYVQRSIAKGETKEDNLGRMVSDVSDSTINSNIISDSLIFWTNDNKASGLFELIECLQLFTTFCHNLPKIFLRGGITYGDFFYDYSGIIKGKDGALMVHPIMVGRALVEVFQLEKQLEIAGSIISNEAIEEARANDEEFFDKKWRELSEEKKIVKYNMPTKREAINVWTINWVNAVTHPTLDELIKGFSNFNKRTDHPDIQAKIMNTIGYYQYIKQNVYV
jgi:hypothetical protein